MKAGADRLGRWLLGPLVVSLLLAACGGDERGVTYLGTPGEPTPLVVDQWVPWVEVGVDGERELALIDTGLPLTLLYSGGFGGLPTGLGDFDLEAFGMRFVDFGAAVIAREPGEPVCEGRAPTALLGHDLLGHFRLGLDYRGGQVALDDRPGGDGELFGQLEGLGEPLTAEVELLGGGTLELAEVGEPMPAPASRLVVEARVEGEARAAIVDTGASLTVISGSLFARLGGDDRPDLCCATVGVIDGTVPARVTRLRELRVGPIVVESLPVLVLDRPELFAALGAEIGRPVQMLIGGSLLRQFAVEVDYPGQRLRMWRYLDRWHLDADEYLLPGFSFCRAAGAQGMVVLDVFEGSDGESKGVQPGQLLVAVDGKPVTDLSEPEARALIRDRPEGETARLSFKATGPGSVDLDVALQRLLPEYR